MGFGSFENIFIFYILFPIILTNGYINISSSFNSISKKNLYCQTIENYPSVNCRVILRAARSVHFSGGGCHEYESNSLTVVLNPDTTLVSFECISENPLIIDLEFGKTKPPMMQYTKFLRERISLNYSDTNTYLVKTKLIIPENQTYAIGKSQGSWINYNLRNSSQPQKYYLMTIRFVFQSLDAYTMHRKGPSKYINGTLIQFFDVPQRLVIDAQENIIYAPCLSTKKLNLFKAEIENNRKSLTNMSVISYNSVEGFKINIRKMWRMKGTLICMVQDIGDDLSKCVQGANCIEFNLEFPKDVQFQPKGGILFGFQSGNSAGGRLLQIPYKTHLVCSSTKNKIKIVTRSGTEILGSDFEFQNNYYEIREPELRYVAEVVVKTKFLQNFIANYSRIRWDCFDFKTMINSWELKKLPMELTYETKEQKFSCRSPYPVNLTLLQCNKISECEKLVNFFYFEHLEFSLEDIEGLQFLKGTDCIVNGIKSSCVSSSTIKSGITICRPSLPPNFMVLPSSALYFRGFNGEIYVHSDNSNVPDEAIVQLDSFNQGDYIALGQNVTFRCEGHSFFHDHGIQWLIMFINESVVPLPKDMAHFLPENSDVYNPLSKVTIWFRDADIKSIICLVPVRNSKRWRNRTMDIKIGWPPRILTLETKKELALTEKGESLRCAAEGNPSPTIQWFRNNAPIASPLNVTDEGDSKLLIFPEYSDEMKGEYTCKATNAVGFDTKTFFVSSTGAFMESSSMGMSTIMAVVFAVLLLLALFPIFFMFRRLKASQELVVRISNAELEEFFNGRENFQKYHYMNNAFSLPYNSKYELTKDSFEINENIVLGSGEFGTVFTGSIRQYEGEFAFKTPKSLTSNEALKGMLSELKILMYIGNHENILKLVGTYTKEIQNGVLYIATELCSLGSLKSHLKRVKRDISQNLDKMSSMFSKCLQWSAEIAHGMEYLSFKHIVHSDLATRNILLNEHEVAKISDFGLSRRMYNYCTYAKANKSDKLPWKWMAIESLREMNFSTQSDIWAFGITVWEIFSLGDIPYPGISWTVEFVEMLEEGMRNRKPKYATDKLYEVMLACWESDPADRPEFHTLRYFFLEYKDDLDFSVKKPAKVVEELHI